MGLADELKRTADQIARDKLRDDEEKAANARADLQAKIQRALEEDVPSQIDWLRNRMTIAAAAGERKIEWKWDTLYGTDKHYKNSSAQVCKAVQDRIKMLLESEGLTVGGGFSGARTPAIDGDGYSRGGNYSSYGGLEISW